MLRALRVAVFDLLASFLHTFVDHIFGFDLVVIVSCFSHNIYVMGHLFSRPCLCPGLVLEMQFSTPPRETAVIVVVVVVFSLVKLRRGRLNYVGGGFPENRF